MMIAGLNMGQTTDGRILKDGAACILKDGEIVVAIAEERLTRSKHSGGFSMALQYCLSTLGARVDDLDMVVVSNCAERPLRDGSDVGIPIDPARIRAMPSHHLSHALAAFATSPFEEALIVVLDNEGNVLEDTLDGTYWGSRVERNSYFLGRAGAVTALQDADDGLDREELGPGEAYRHFTYMLGWNSYVFAGNTMGLASYGQINPFGGVRIFDLKSGKIRCLLANGRKNPAKAVLDLGLSQGVLFGPPRTPQDFLTSRHADIAALIQNEFERALVYKVKHLQERTGITNLCIGGGVALNCVANRKILDMTGIEKIYICPAPGDSGQCVGNAIYGWTNLAGRSLHSKQLNPHLGKTYSESEIASVIDSYADRLVCRRSQDTPSEAAALIAAGYVIGWFQGGSELGPRALGARSILADARLPAMRDYLNLKVKQREAFRPYAPSVLLSHAQDYFDLPQPSPYMELTATVHNEVRKKISSVTHVDGSSRPQTVLDDSNDPFCLLLHSFNRLTGLPLILNTSFNLGGEPIVESPKDAIECLLKSNLDVLVIGDFFVTKKTFTTEPGFYAWACA